MKQLSLSSHSRLKHNVLEENLSKKELESLKNLSKILDIMIKKSDKRNSNKQRYATIFTPPYRILIAFIFGFHFNNAS